MTVVVPSAAFWMWVPAPGEVPLVQSCPEVDHLVQMTVALETQPLGLLAVGHVEEWVPCHVHLGVVELLAETVLGIVVLWVGIGLVAEDPAAC